MTIMPGAHECMARFSSWRRALVTGSARGDVDYVVKVTGWTFEKVVASEDVENSKPAPDGYLAGAGHLGVDPSECLVIEDSTAGIAAGRAAGATVVAVRAGNFLGQDQSGGPSRARDTRRAHRGPDRRTRGARGARLAHSAPGSRGPVICKPGQSALLFLRSWRHYSTSCPRG